MTTFQSSTSIVAVIVVCVACAIGAPGCFSGSDVLSEDRGAVVTPTSFEDEQVTWTCAGSLSETDVQRLAAYFGRNPSVAENSIVRGDPLIYATADGTRRYYWVRPGAGEAEWLCLQFGRRSVQMTDGNGEPFAAH